MTEDFLIGLQSLIAERILGDSWIAEAPGPRVITESLGDIESEIERDLTGTGLTIVVITPKLAAGSASDPAFCQVTAVIGVGERTAVNRGPTGTQKTAAQVATSILALLSRWEPSDIWGPMRFVERSLDQSGPDAVAYNLTFTLNARIVTEEV